MMFAPRLAAIGLLCTGLGLTAATPAPAQTARVSPFGHSYEQKFSEARWWTMDFQATRLTFTAMSGARKGEVVMTVDNPTVKQLATGIYLVSWQEADKSTAVHVYDFASGHAYFQTTKPDGTFLRLEGPMTLAR